MTTVRDGYPQIQVPTKNFINFQRAVGGFVDELTENGFTLRLIGMYYTKGAAVVSLGKGIRLASKIPTLTAWEGSRL
jgi:hypothetical protein